MYSDIIAETLGNEQIPSTQILKYKHKLSFKKLFRVAFYLSLEQIPHHVRQIQKTTLFKFMVQNQIETTINKMRNFHETI